MFVMLSWGNQSQIFLVNNNKPVTILGPTIIRVNGGSGRIANNVSVSLVQFGVTHID